jgi:ribulose-bisphosphate carboxylase large chain
VTTANPDRSTRREFTARYFVESCEPIQKAAEVIAGEQSSGTFLSLPGETEALKERARARVTRIDPLDSVETPTLRSAFEERRARPPEYYRAEVEIAFPVDNVGANIPTLLATIAGNLFELGEVTGLRLLDIDMPSAYAAQFPGPKFGVEGTRRLAGVYGRPIIGTIIKPSIGLSPAQTAEMVDSMCAAGIDFIKDDELLADPTYAPFDERLAAVMPVLKRHADRLGRMPMYAINISGTIDQMLSRHDAVMRAGGTCLMISVNWVGFAAAQHLRERTELPIHGHRNGWGAFTRHPGLGFSFAAYQKLWRLTGIDHLHVNGPKSKFWEPDESVLNSARHCLGDFAGVREIMPVFSSGQWAGQAPTIFGELRSTDLMHLAGGGIIGHPDGIAAGVASMRQGWEAAVAGRTLVDYAKDHAELSKALIKFGK